jgi:hypothetical protein
MGDIFFSTLGWYSLPQAGPHLTPSTDFQTDLNSLVLVDGILPRELRQVMVLKSFGGNFRCMPTKPMHNTKQYINCTIMLTRGGAQTVRDYINLSQHLTTATPDYQRSLVWQRNGSFILLDSW